MGYYQANPACGCGRCRMRGLMGPAVLVTLGLLFLAGNMSGYSFDRTWPILLIVIGAIKVARYVLPDDGHFNPGQYPPPPYGQYPPAQGVPYGAANGVANSAPMSGPIVTPPPAPIAGSLSDGKPENGEVHNG